MKTLRTATRNQAQTTLITLAAVQNAIDIWSRLGLYFSSQWEDTVRAEAIQNLQDGRANVIDQSAGYVESVLAEQGLKAAPAARINTQRLLSTTPDGRTVGGLLDIGIIRAKTLISKGEGWMPALDAQRDFIASAVEDTIRQTASDYVSIDSTRRPGVTYYVRSLSLPSCRLCIQLAGAMYKSATAFQRHQKCDCTHVPTTTAEAASPMLTDPEVYFKSLTREQQDKVFGANDAQAIRDGANPITVINKRLRGHSKRDSSNLTIDNIYFAAGGNRAKAIELLKENGFLSESGRVHLRYKNPGLRVDSRDLSDPTQLTSAERRAAFRAGTTR